MSRATLLCVSVCVSVFVLVAPVVAQEEAQTVGQLFFVQPKGGEVLQWEAAYKKHVDWHRSKKDTWSWPVWEIVSGERTGQYVIGTFGHPWKDLDRGEFGAADRADAIANQGARGTVAVELWRSLPELSRPPEGEPALAVAYYSHLNQGMMDDYMRAVRKINDAISKANWGGGGYRSVVVASGEDPTVVRWSARSSWGDFGPAETPFMEMMEKAYGRQEVASIMDTITRSTHCRRSEVWASRPDLSYEPPGESQ